MKNISFLDTIVRMGIILLYIPVSYILITQLIPDFIATFKEVILGKEVEKDIFEQ